jgi:hypothetical protein
LGTVELSGSKLCAFAIFIFVKTQKKDKVPKDFFVPALSLSTSLCYTMANPQLPSTSASQGAQVRYKTHEELARLISKTRRPDTSYDTLAQLVDIDELLFLADVQLYEASQTIDSSRADLHRARVEIATYDRARLEQQGHIWYAKKSDMFSTQCFHLQTIRSKAPEMHQSQQGQLCPSSAALHQGTDQNTVPKVEKLEMKTVELEAKNCSVAEKQRPALVNAADCIIAAKREKSEEEAVCHTADNLNAYAPSPNQRRSVNPGAIQPSRTLRGSKKGRRSTHQRRVGCRRSQRLMR